MSSLKNLLLGVFVARTLGAESLGALGVALVVHSIAVNSSRALSTDPLMIRYSAVAARAWRSASRASGGVALLAGIASGCLCVLAGAVVKVQAPESQLGNALIILGVLMPGLTLQDSWRYAFFAAGKGSKTFTNDTVWTVLLVAALFAGEMTGGSYGVAWALAAFGGTATICALLGMRQAGLIPRPRLSREWLRRHRDLGPRFFIENTVLGAGSHLHSVVVAATAGLAATGAIRGAELLIGPITALLMGVAQVAVPEAARSLRRGLDSLQRLCLALSCGLAAVSAAWAVTLLVVFPFGIGEMLLGTVWGDTRALVLAVTLSATAGCFHVGPSAGLRALGRADITMRCQIAASGIYVTFSAAGAVLWGAPGAVWGTAVASTIGAVIWWSQLRRAQREYQAPEDPPSAVATIAPRGSLTPDLPPETDADPR
jgi:O-antigen/teichoic acid export membrane protein